MVCVVPLSDADLSTRALTPVLAPAAVGARHGVIGGEALAPYRSLYLRRVTPEAAPKCISGSTSYLQV